MQNAELGMVKKYTQNVVKPAWPHTSLPPFQFPDSPPSHRMAATVSTEAHNGETASPRNRFLSWLEPKQSDKRDAAFLASDEKSTSSNSDLSIGASVEGDLKPVSFFGLFRSAHLLSLVYN